MRTVDEVGWEGTTGAELWRVPLGGLQVSENESAKSGWDKNGEVRGWDGFITAHVDLVPDS